MVAKSAENSRTRSAFLVFGGVNAGARPLRAWTAVLLLVFAAVAGFIALSAYLFVWPATDAPGPADALVVLGPGRHGERLAKATELLRRGLAPIVVVSRSRRGRHWPLEAQLCARRRAICFRGRPFTTRGEARIVGRLAAEHGWKRLLLVTSTYHVTRARLLYGRCVKGQIAVVAANADAGLRERLRLIAHEWGGLLDAVLFARSC
jgi:uncharacterized SAM-binding protein YcdF (DUF218 family)